MRKVALLLLLSLNALAVPIPNAVGVFRGLDGGTTTRVWCDNATFSGGGGTGYSYVNAVIDGGSITVANFPATQAVSLATAPTTPVTGTFFQATQPVSGSVTVLNQTAATSAVAVRCVNAAGSAFEACGGTSSGGLTNTELRATAVPISGSITATVASTTITGSVAVTGPLTDTQLRFSAVPISGAVTGAFFQATQPVSGTLTCNAGTGTLATTSTVNNTAFGTAVAVRCVNTAGTAFEACGGAGASGLTNTELRATAVPVSLTSTTITGSVAVTGPLTNTELRASAVSVLGPLTNAELRGSAVTVAGTRDNGGGNLAAGNNHITIGGSDGTNVRPLSIDATGKLNVLGAFFQASQPVNGIFWQATQPVSGPFLTDAQLRASSLPVSGTRLNSGVTVTAGQSHLTVGGSDGTNLRPLSTDTTGRVNVNATMASTTITGTVAVSGTFWQATQPVSGTVSLAATSTGFGTLNGTIPTQSSLISARAVVLNGSPSAITAGNNAPNIADTEGRLYVNTSHPRTFNCRLAEATTTTLVELTGCPVVGAQYYMTGWRTCGGVATAATVPVLIRSGLGVNCVTTPTTIDSCWHIANGCCEVNFTTPFKVKNGDAICGIDATVGTKSIMVFGFLVQ